MERSREENAAEVGRKVRVSEYIVSDAEAYSESVAGVEIAGVRAEPGHGPTRVLAAEEDRFTSTSCRVGFPMLNRTTIDDDRLVLAVIARGAPGSRWCEFDLEPGTVLVYGPGAEHTAINRPGLDFTFVSAAPGSLEAIAEELSLSIEVPERGSVERIRPSSATRPLRGAFLEFRRAAARCTDRTGRLAAEVVPAMATFLSGAAEDWRKPTRERIDGRHLVFKCIDYAEAIGRAPSLGELCALTHVSQRSLRRAFISEFDLPPTQFFRIWALGKAHSRLRDADDGFESVTRVGLELGFTHLGRFAGNYQSVYGEVPSTTLAKRPALASPTTQVFPR